jgi:CelD/BcsL family acetyltransferase involved in cellulose biosynthesis
MGVLCTDATPEVTTEEVEGDLPTWLQAPWEGLRTSLLRRGFAAGPFHSFEWARVYARELGVRVGTPKTVLAWCGPELRGIVTFVAEKRRLTHAPARLLRSLSDDHSQRWDALLADRAAAQAIMTRLLVDRSWDVLELRDVPDGATGAELLVEAARAAGCTIGEWPSQRSPLLALPAEGQDAKFRANLRRRARRLAEEVGPVSLEIISDGAAADAALDEALRLEAAGWKGTEGTAIACDPALVRMYQGLAHALAERGTLVLVFLRAGERRVAMHFAAVEDGIYYLFKVGSDPTLARFGLGHLLIAEVAREFAARGVRELDFLGDEADWKREWTPRVGNHRWRYVFRPSLRGRALAAWKLHAVPRLKQLAEGLRR